MSFEADLEKFVYCRFIHQPEVCHLHGGPDKNIFLIHNIDLIGTAEEVHGGCDGRCEKKPTYVFRHV